MSEEGSAQGVAGTFLSDLKKNHCRVRLRGSSVAVASNYYYASFGNAAVF